MNYEIYKYDLENRFPAYTFGELNGGSYYKITVKAGETVIASSDKMAQLDAILFIREKLLKGENPTSILTQIQIDGLTETILDGVTILNSTTGYVITRLGSGWVGGGLQPAEMIDNTTAQTITQTAATLLFNSVKFTDSEYTLNAPAGSITFDKADGSRVYEISYKTCIDGVDATGTASRATVTVRAFLDAIEILEAENCIYLREDAYDSTNTSVAISFFVKPTIGQVFTLTVGKNKDSTCEATRRFLNVKRIQ